MIIVNYYTSAYHEFVYAQSQHGDGDADHTAGRQVLVLRSCINLLAFYQGR